MAAESENPTLAAANDQQGESNDAENGNNATQQVGQCEYKHCLLAVRYSVKLYGKRLFVNLIVNRNFVLCRTMCRAMEL
jgi:hypothetical protein